MPERAVRRLDLQLVVDDVRASCAPPGRRPGDARSGPGRGSSGRRPRAGRPRDGPPSPMLVRRAACRARRPWSAAGSTGSSLSGPLVVTVQSLTLRLPAVGERAASVGARRRRRCLRAMSAAHTRPAIWAAMEFGRVAGLVLPPLLRRVRRRAARSPRRRSRRGSRAAFFTPRPGARRRRGRPGGPARSAAPPRRAGARTRPACPRRRSSAGTSRPPSAGRRTASRRSAARRALSPCAHSAVPNS